MVVSSCFDLASPLKGYALLTNDGLFDEAFSEDQALVRPFQALFNNES
jgi:hypothetical protein